MARELGPAGAREPVVTSTPSGPVVIKLGGRSLDAAGATRELAAEVSQLCGASVLVHGGGAEVTAWCSRLGLAPRFLDGLRVTDPDTLDVAVAVLAGLANTRLVASLRDAGVDAVGLSALDGGTVEVRRHQDAARLGAVGEPVAIRPRLLETLLGEGRTPVLASIGAQGEQLLNVNADDLAAALAGSLHARVLLLLSDTPGLKLDGQVVARLEGRAIATALAHPDVKDGMRPKLRAAAAAINAGAQRVVIGAWSGPGTLTALLEGAGGGTTLAADPMEV
ncbi:MAG: acetylglutamate kinase, partial [Candidatus Eisenbacteria bacterium]